MKKLILILFLFISIPSFSQLRYQDIPIDGPSDFFINGLIKKGFKYVRSEDNLFIMKGTFLNVPCITGVLTTHNTKFVARILVAINGYDSWQIMKANYDEIKRMYSDKYGAPMSIETLKENHKHKELYHLFRNEFTYWSSWVYNGDEIELDLVSANDGNYIYIKYTNRRNFDIYKKEQLKLI